MKNILINMVLSLIMINCNAQNIETIKINNSKKDTMEYFDINRYKENKTVNGYIFKRPNGEIVRQLEHEDHTFYEEVNRINSPYHIYKEFHTNTMLKSKTTEFYTFPIGTTKEYDENGKLIKETDWEKDYPFSVDDLIKKIKNEFNFDLVHDYEDKKNTQIIVFRQGPFPITNSYIPTNTTFYKINFLDKKNRNILLYISGIDGSIITEIIDNEYIIPKGYVPPKNLYNPNQQKKSTSFLASPDEKGTSKKAQLGIAYSEGSKIPEDTYQIYEGRAYTKTEWEEFHKSLPWWKRIM